ncbi:MAG: hypothetical protein JSU94_17445 [Phycisphaerales bacterium]|nr:MAG: hypothetical protein JSU94_17445 [Phycisphaerales bacterium]
MAGQWAQKTAEQLLDRGLIDAGACLILGGADTGKTTLAEELSKRLALGKPVGIIDADVGQSHIGPPTTVGWAVAQKPHAGFDRLTPGGIDFVGDITPVGHLLQLTAAIVQCARVVSGAAEAILIDTPGFVSTGPAAALWWTVERLLKPRTVLAVERGGELGDILAGLKGTGCRIERVKSAADVRAKSPQQRQAYRQRRFEEYFEDSRLHDICLKDVAVRARPRSVSQNMPGRLVGLRDENGRDAAIGAVGAWEHDSALATIRAPKLDIEKIRCIVVGDVTVDIHGA